MKRIFLILIILGLAALLAILLINLRIASYAKNKVQIIENIPADEPPRTAIVLGARVWDGGVASNTLHDRVLTGVELFKAGRASKLLMTGGGEESAVMKKLAIELGVPESGIVTDTLGLRTYDSCFRARSVFGVKQAIVVTQDYHLPRALYLCENMGIESFGVDAKRRGYDGENYFWFREYLSRVMAWYEINFQSFPPEPADKQPIE